MGSHSIGRDVMSDAEKARAQSRSYTADADKPVVRKKKSPEKKKKAA